MHHLAKALGPKHRKHSQAASSPRARAVAALWLARVCVLLAGFVGTGTLIAAGPAKVAYVGSDHTLVILNRGLKDDFREDQAVCFYRGTPTEGDDDDDDDGKGSAAGGVKPHACGIVILTSQGSAVVVVDRQFAKTVAKGQTVRSVSHIPPELAGELGKQHAARQAGGRGGRRPSSGLRVEFVAKDESFCLIKLRPDLALAKGMRACFVGAAGEGAPPLCSDLVLVNKVYMVVKLGPSFAGKIKVGMAVEIDPASAAAASTKDSAPAPADSPGVSQGGTASDPAVASALKEAAAIAAKQLRDKNEEISNLKKKNRVLADEINAKPIPLRLGLYTTMAVMASSAYNAVAFKTVKADESSRATLWEAGQRVTQQLPGLGAALQAELNESWYAVGMVDYKSFAIIRRTTIADEFDANTLAHVTTKAYSIGLAGGILARLFKALQGRFEIGLYATMERLYFSFAAELVNEADETSVTLARMGETRDTYGLSVPVGVAWTMQRYLAHLHLDIGLPLAVRTVNSDRHIFASPFVRLTGDGEADLEQALNLQKNPLSVAISVGVFL